MYTITLCTAIALCGFFSSADRPQVLKSEQRSLEAGFPSFGVRRFFRRSGTDQVWFYDVDADGWSLDDKRTQLLTDEKLGAVPEVVLSEDEHTKNNLPDVLARWKQREKKERERLRTEQSFCVPKSDIAAQGYDLSLNRYKEVVHEMVEHRKPGEILKELAKIEEEIEKGMKELKEMLK